MRYMFTAICLFAGTLLNGQKHLPINIPKGLDRFIESLKMDELGRVTPTAQFEWIDSNLLHVMINCTIDSPIQQNDWKVSLTSSFIPDFFWTPHLTPDEGYIVAQHVFRSPALIFSDKEKRLAIVPDLDLISHNGAPEWYLDLNAPEHSMTIGVSKSRVKEHVLFVKQAGQTIMPPQFRFGFYLFLDQSPDVVFDPWRKPLDFLWKKWGHALYAQREPIRNSLEPYVQHTYDWAFHHWSSQVWQEFNLNGKKVGAPVFIVNVTQSPNYPGPVNEREFRSIWNQAWFSSLRSASGLYRYAKRTGDQSLLIKANMTKELALSFPQKDGLFNSVIYTPMVQIKEKGELVNRSTGWQNYRFGNSNRNPRATGGDAGKSPYHILDMSWTAYQMLVWYKELEKDERLLDYAKNYASKLISLQDQQGFFPAWIDLSTGQPLDQLLQSPETALSASFLFKIFEITRDNKYLESARRAIDAVVREILFQGRWEDFETYWSCSQVFDSLLGKQIERNGQYKQNTLSIFWTAQAFYDAWKISGEKNWLSLGQRALDELLMYQASWQPPFIAIHALGGFGVMNADGEWNDSRQSLFAELIMNYGIALRKEEYLERGKAALKASFVMMYCSENQATKIQWQKVYPFFNEKDYGFMMENYGHGGTTNSEGLGIGEFTIYDWGNGAAAEAYNRMIDHFGEDFLRK